jgi:hypothetical protein
VAESTGDAVALVVAAFWWVGTIPVVLLEAFLLAGGQRWVLRGQHALRQVPPAARRMHPRSSPALMAAAQAFILRRRIKQAGWWVAIRALAWSIGLPSLLLAGAWIANMSAYGITGLVLLMFASFALVGAFVGLVEGYALTRLMRLVVDWQVRLATLAAPVVPRISRRSKRLPAAGAFGPAEHIGRTIG